ncbi:MAG: ABC transporter ATP-binding protein [Akkermansia sp.]
MSHHTIHINHLNYTYPDGTPALHDICMEVGHGESIAVIGGNGAGKSTLLLHLCGAIIPLDGEIRIGGIPIIKSTLSDIRRTVGMVFQNPDDQLFMPRVYDDVAFGPLNMGLPNQDVEQRTKKALKQVGAWELRDKMPHKLSGGQQRASSIATILSMEPSILVMDEPTANLDHKARRNIINILREFHHTKFIATHDLRLARALCPRSILMHEGRIIADGTSSEIFANRSLMESCNLEPIEPITPGSPLDSLD